jgi:hypothetical protein
MVGKLKPLDVEREMRPGKYADGDGLRRTHSKMRDNAKLKMLVADLLVKLYAAG